MKHRLSSQMHAFTRIELAVVLIGAVVLGSLWCAGTAKRKPDYIRIRCVSHLKQNSLAMKIFASDSGDRYPYQQVPGLVVTTPHHSIALTNTTRTNVDFHAVWAH